MGSRGRRCSAVVLAALAAASIAVALVSRPAAAEPTETLSPLVDEVSPCGNLGLALITLDLATRGALDSLGAALPPAVAETVFTAYGRAVLAITQLDSAACDAIPARQFDTTCDVDDQVGGAIASLPLPGLPALPVDPIGLVPVPTDAALAGALIDVIAAFERETGANAALSEQLAEPLGCVTKERLTSRPAPAIGSAGGGIDLTPPAGGGTVDPTSQVAGKSQQKPKAVLAPDAGQGPASADAAAQASAAANGAAAPALAVADNDTRRNVFGALAFVTALAAAWGFASPGRKPVDPS